MIQILTYKFIKGRPLGIPKHSLEDITKTDLKELFVNVINFSELAEGRFRVTQKEPDLNCIGSFVMNKFLAFKLIKSRPLGIPRHKFEDNTTTNLKELSVNVISYTELANGREPSRALFNTAYNVLSSLNHMI